MSARVPCSPAAPRFGQGTHVLYRDHHERWQEGEVLAVEATWRWGKADPLILYTISHPTYRGRRTYVREDAISHRVALASSLLAATRMPNAPATPVPALGEAR